MKESLEWWNNLSFEEKFYQIIPWLKGKGKNVTDIHPNEVSDDNINEMYKIYNDLK